MAANGGLGHRSVGSMPPAGRCAVSRCRVQRSRPAERIHTVLYIATTYSTVHTVLYIATIIHAIIQPGSKTSSPFVCAPLELGGAAVPWRCTRNLDAHSSTDSKNRTPRCESACRPSYDATGRSPTHSESVTVTPFRNVILYFFYDICVEICSSPEQRRNVAERHRTHVAALGLQCAAAELGGGAALDSPRDHYALVANSP